MKETLIKRFFAGVLAVIMLLSVTAVASAQTTEYFGQDGLAVPGDANVERALSGESAEPVRLISVASENSLMTVLGRSYVRENREGIDLSFPLWTNDCGALRFLGDELWLVTNELELLTSYDGLYISEGRTYTDEYGQADPDEFIFVRVSDSLYINAQSATLVTLLGDYPIQTNSVLKMTEDYMSWFSPDGECLVFDRNTGLYSAKLRIGENEYDYHDLLDVLGLINEATAKLNKGVNADEEINEAMDILGIEKEYKKKTETRDNITEPAENANAKEQEAESDPKDADAEEISEESGIEGAGGEGDGSSGDSDSEEVPQESLEPVPEETPKTTPTPTPTAEPSPSGQPTAEPSPTVIPSGTPSPSPSTPTTNTPSPSGTPETTPTASASPTVRPSKTPSPTSSAKPSASPTSDPSATPIPSGTVVPTQSARPTAETTGTPAPSGSVKPATPIPGESEEPEPPEPTTSSQHTGGPTKTPKPAGSSTPAPAGPTTVPTDPPYIAPAVSLTELNVWSYAANGKIVVTDVQNNIVGKIRVSVYKRLDSGSYTGVTPDGYRIWTAKKGLSSVGGRRSFSGSSEFTISTLPPDTTLWLQYTYSYNEVNIVNGERKSVRRTISSNFYEFTTLPCDNTNISYALTDWDIDFAAATDGIVLRNFTLKNSSNYNPDDTSFDNFKKNTINYISRIQLTAQKRVDDTQRDKSQKVGSPVTINIGTSALKNAKSGASIFSSTTPKLDPNSYYTFTVKALDKFGNAIPMLLNSRDTADSEFFEDFYTAKASPTVTFKEVSNVADKYTTRITINDPQGALLKDDDGTIHDICFTATDTSGSLAELNGTWSDGTKINSSDTPIYELALTEPTDGKSYEFTLDSLAFAQTYYLEITGDYSPQPDPAKNVNTKLPSYYDVQFSKTRCYTASLSSGMIGFNVSFPVSSLKDTYLTIESAMNETTTTEILPLVDQYIYSIKNNSTKKEEFKYIFDMEDLSVPCSNYTYDKSSRALILETGDTDTPKITLTGDESFFYGKTVWEAMQATSYYDDGKAEYVYTNGATLRMTLPADTLVSKTTYDFSITPVVIKSGRTYTIPSTVTGNSFTTRRIQPVREFSDFIVASGSAIFKDFKINDPDETIKSNGLIYVKLIYNETSTPTTISVKRIYANDEAQDLEFDGLIEGAKYTIQFVAAVFNDTELNAYITNNKVIFDPDNFTGNEDLNGSISLKSLDYDYVLDTGSVVWSCSGPEALERIRKTENGEITDDDKKWGTDSGYIITEYIPIPDDVNFIEYGGDYPASNVNTSFYINLYDSNYNYIDYWTTSYGASRILPITCNSPKEVKYVRIKIPHTEEALQNEGVILRGYKTAKENIFTSDKYSEYVYAGKADKGDGKLVDYASTTAVYKLPVKPGEVYTRSEPGWSDMSLYDHDGTYKGTLSAGKYWKFTIPDGVYYISSTHVTSKSPELYKVLDVPDGYTASVGITVNDVGGKLKDNPTAKLALYASDTIHSPDYGDTPLREINLPLVKDSTDTTGKKLILDPKEAEQIFNSLNPNCGFKLELSVKYNGSDVVLDSCEFRTDTACRLIHNNAELVNAISANPYANLIVANDFEHNMTTDITFYGTIDFQGHVITRKQGFNGYLIGNIGNGGSVTNLVYDYPADATVGAPLFYCCDGLIENVILRTNGVLTNNSQILCYSIRQTGTARNIIMQLNGDLILNGFGLVIYNRGLIENVIVYATSRAGIIVGSEKAFFSRYIMGAIRHVYIISDMWMKPSDAGTYSGGYFFNYQANYSYDPYDGIYVVGDYYKKPGEAKNTLSPMSDLTGFYTSFGEDLYYIANNTYTQSGVVKKAEYSQLVDQAWQDNILGDGFDTSVVTLDTPFYPRLIMPECMMIYQDYIPISTHSMDETPKLVDDFVAEGKTLTDTEGYIRLSFENKNSLPISSVTIDGLDVMKNTDTGEYDIENLGIQEDGLYDVIAHVQVSAEKPKYLSAYKITGYTWVDGAKTGTTDKAYTYTTDSIEFWKEIADQSMWTEINNNMDWNYKLTNDITFSDTYPIQQISINGSTNSLSKDTYFTGKLDGCNHTLYGIHIDNVGYPKVFYGIKGASSCIRNLRVDGMTLSNYEDGSQSNKYAGFIGYVYTGCVDNVHITNSSLTANGYMGLIAGYQTGAAPGSIIKNCSVTESTIKDRGDDYGIYCGGIAGYSVRCDIFNSYVSGISITCNESSTIIDVAGIAGHGMARIQNCYAQGTITANAQHAAGITADTQAPSGLSFGDVGNAGNWSYMTIFNTSGVSGGVVSLNDPTLSNCIAMGDVYGVNGSSHRISGTAKKGTRCYAYDGQAVTGIEKGKIDDATMLLSSEELKSASTWLDVVQTGDAFDYSCLENNFCPKLYSTEGELLPNQKDIYLPGQSLDPRLEITAAEYKSTGGEQSFTVGVSLRHPGIDSEDMMALFDNNKPDGLCFTISGMNISEAQIASGNVKFTLGKGSEQDSEGRTIQTNLLINIKRVGDVTLLEMRDNYSISVSYPMGTQSLKADAVVDFGVPLYWEITSLTEWNKAVEKHGTTGENFLIKGSVDFGGSAPDYTGLKINRLEGDGLDSSGKPIYGFKNMTYAPTGKDVQPWITGVSAQVLKLRFENFSIDYAVPFTTVMASGVETPGMEAIWTAGGVISSANGAADCVIDSFSYVCSSAKSAEFSPDRSTKTQIKCSTASYGGFFGKVYGNLQNIDISNATIEAKNGGYYIGAIAGYQEGGSLVNVKARTVSVSALKSTQYVCGLLGNNDSIYLNGVYQKAIIDIDGLTVEANSTTAGVAYWLHNPVKFTMKNFSITTTSGDAYGYDYSWCGYLINTLVENGSITGANNAAGLCYNTTYSDYNRIIRNVTITAGTGNAAGMTLQFGSYVNTSIVENCTITSKSGGASGMVCQGYGGNGGIRGCKVINTTISGRTGAAAFHLGPAKDTEYVYSFSDCYVGSDVTVKSVTGAAGSLSNYLKAVQIDNCISGATVISEKGIAGGLVGKVEGNESGEQPTFTITNSAFNGTVSGKTYAGGLIGFVNHTDIRPTVDTFKGDIVAGEISGDTASLLMNNVNSTAAAGDAVVAFNAATLVNGATPEAIREAEKASSAGATHNEFPEHCTIVTDAGDFNKPEFYKALGWTTTKWIFSHLGTDTNKSMPYTTYSYVVTLKGGPNGDSDVPLPEGVEKFDSTTVYVSGADSVNIETTTPNKPVSFSVTKDGTTKSYTRSANDYGVITVSFGFRDSDSITVDGKTYTGKDLRRTVMTYAGKWYYTDSAGDLHSNNDNVAHEEGATDVILSNVVNIWRGKALCSDGKLYDVSDAAVELTPDAPDGEVFFTCRPLYSYTAKNIPGGDAAVDVYYFSTVFTQNKKPTVYSGRILKAGSKFYSVTPAQNVYADGVLFRCVPDLKTDKNYYALLDRNGNLTSYRDTMTLGKLTPSGIIEISNNFDYDGNVLMAQYADGVVAVDYTTGKTIVNTRPTLSLALSFAKNMLSSIFGSGSGNVALGTVNPTDVTDDVITGTSTQSTGSAASSEGTYNGEGSADGDGTNSVSGSKDTNGTASGSGSLNTKDNDKQSTADGGDGNEGSGSGGAVGAAVPVKTAKSAVDGKTGDNVIGAAGAIADAGTGTTEGKNPVAAPAASTAPAPASPAPSASAEPAASPEPDSGKDDGAKDDKTEEDKKSEDEKSEEEKSGDEKDETDTGLWYVPDEGITDDGELVVSENNVTVDYVPGEGVYVDGELCYVEDEERMLSGGVSVESGVSQSASGGAAVSVMSVMAYDEASGEYVPTELEGKVREITGVNEDGSPKLREEPEAEPIVEDSTVKEPDAKLNVNHGFARSLTTTDRGGVTLILIVAGAFIVLVAVYLIRRKE